MKRFITIIIALFLSSSMFSQETNESNRGTINVQKRGTLSKIQFDDVNYRLIGIDQYGNVLDSAVLEFQMSVTIKGVFYAEQTIGSVLTYKMQQQLGRCDRSSKIFFDKIKAKDQNGTVVEMPKFQYSFGYRDENNE